jgi:hypothetical protein
MAMENIMKPTEWGKSTEVEAKRIESVDGNFKASKFTSGVSTESQLLLNEIRVTSRHFETEDQPPFN